MSGKRHNMRKAFTLVELMVSMGLLAILMTMAAAVFKITMDSTGQARHFLDINNHLYLLEQNLIRDLENVDPKNSMMIIQAHQANAWWTRAGFESDYPTTGGMKDPADGYPHPRDPEREDPTPNDPASTDDDTYLIPPRADVLMLFTPRQTTSLYDPSIKDVKQVQVVYSHAELGELDPDGLWLEEPAPFPAAPPTTPLLTDQFVAAEWVLTRRAILLLEDPAASPGDLYELRFLGTDLTAPPNDADNPLDYVGFNSEKVAQRITVPPENLSFTPPLRWYSRSHLDLTPPAVQAKRLAPYLIPNCASFKIEWTVSDPHDPGYSPTPPAPLAYGKRVVWHDPALAPNDPNTVPSYSDLYDDFPPGSNPRGVEFRKRFSRKADTTVPKRPDVIAAGTPIWYAKDPDPVNPGDYDPFWPKALKITVDLFDSAGRFERPIRHVMVIQVGSE